MKLTTRIWLPLAWALCTCLLSSAALAGVCSYNSSGGVARAVSYRFNNPPILNVTGNEPPGTVLWTSSAVVADASIFVDCPGRAGSAGLIDVVRYQTTVPAGGYTVMQTNIAGIGYVISPGSFLLGLSEYPNNPDGPTPNNVGNTMTATLRVVKLNGGIPPGISRIGMLGGYQPFATWYVGTNQLEFANFYMGNIVISAPPPPLTCSLRAPTPIDLGTVSSTVLRAGGAGQGPEVQFDVNLDNCSRSLTSVSYSVEPVGSIEGTQCRHQLSTTGTAQGLAISVYDPSRSPFCFSRSYAVPLSTVNSAVIPLRARMVGLGGSVSPGTVRGAVIVRVDYQ